MLNNRTLEPVQLMSYHQYKTSTAVCCVTSRQYHPYKSAAVINERKEMSFYFLVFFCLEIILTCGTELFKAAHKFMRASSLLTNDSVELHVSFSILLIPYTLTGHLNCSITRITYQPLVL